MRYRNHELPLDNPNFEFETHDQAMAIQSHCRLVDAKADPVTIAFSAAGLKAKAWFNDYRRYRKFQLREREDRKYMVHLMRQEQIRSGVEPDENSK